MDTVIFHRLAAQEYRRAYAWYRQRSPGAAERFREDVNKAVRRIAAQSEFLPIVNGPHRRVRVGKFPYVLIFRHESPGVQMIMAAAHTSRRPGYWRRRK